MGNIYRATSRQVVQFPTDPYTINLLDGTEFIAAAGMVVRAYGREQFTQLTAQGRIKP